MAIFQDSIMCTKSSQTSGRLRVTQAFIALASIPGSSPVSRTLSIAIIGTCEIRMFNAPSTWSGDALPLWIELFDHGARVSVDSCSCREVDEAVAAFDEFFSDAETLNQVCRPEANDARV
jgi:hypothetical protein